MRNLPSLSVLVSVAALFPASAGELPAQESARPCDAIEAHRQFDFWLGDWDVVDAKGAPLGTNSITRPEQECMLLERWEAAGGGRGTSINYFDPASGKWVQYWVAASWMLDLEGELVDGEMRMEGESRRIDRPGETTRIRGTWTPLEDGRVRQVFERWNEESDGWDMLFEGFYVRTDT